MDRRYDPEDIMALTEEDTDRDDASRAARVLAAETGRDVDEFSADEEEYPHPHPSDAETVDLRDSE